MTTERRLLELKIQRNEEAKKVIEAAKFVWKHKGESLFKTYPPLCTGAVAIKLPQSIQIYLCESAKSLEIFMGGNKSTLLYQYAGNLMCFRPGPWVKKLLDFVDTCSDTYLRRELIKFEEIDY